MTNCINDLKLTYEDLLVITKPIESLDTFDDCNKYLTNPVISYKSFLNYNGDMVIRMLHICDRTNKLYKFKLLPFYKYLNIVNDYSNSIKCHVEFIILKYILVIELLNEINFKTKRKTNRQFTHQYKKIVDVFQNLNFHDACQISSIILNDIHTLFDCIDCHEIYGNISDYCNCIISLLLLIKNNLGNSDIELSKKLTYFLIVNPCFNVIKIKELQKRYNLSESIMDNSRKVVTMDYFYFYNIIQLVHCDFNNKLFLKNDDMLMFDIIIKLILQKVPNISCFLFRKDVALVFNYVLLRHEKYNILSDELFLYVKNQMYKNGFQIEYDNVQPWCYYPPNNYDYSSRSDVANRLLRSYIVNPQINNNFSRLCKIKNVNVPFCIRERNSYTFYNSDCRLCSDFLIFECSTCIHYVENSVEYYNEYTMPYFRIESPKKYNYKITSDMHFDFCECGGRSYTYNYYYRVMYYDHKHSYCYYPETQCNYCESTKCINKYGFGYDKYGDKIINFNVKSKNYKQSKSRHIDKYRSRIKMKRKNKFKIKNEFRHNINI